MHSFCVIISWACHTVLCSAKLNHTVYNSCMHSTKGMNLIDQLGNLTEVMMPKSLMNPWCQNIWHNSNTSCNTSRQYAEKRINIRNWAFWESKYFWIFKIWQHITSKLRGNYYEKNMATKENLIIADDTSTCLKSIHFKNTVTGSSFHSKLWPFSIIHQLTSKQSQLIYYWKWS